MGRILWRAFFERDRTRSDLPAGCPEQLDWALLKEAWRYDTQRVPRIEEERRKYGADVPVVRLRSDREIARFLEELTPPSP